MTKSTQVQTIPQPTALQLTFAEAAKSMVAKSINSDDILLGILNATTIDEILESTTLGLQSIIGTPMTINRAQLHESDYADGLAAYVVMFVTFDDGTSTVVTSGAQVVVAQVVRMQMLDAFPMRCSSKQATRPTEKGYYPIALTKADPVEESF